MEHFNELTPAEAERLAILAEECGEVVQMVGKILRHGYESCHPDAASPDLNNRTTLEHELGDLQWIVQYMCAENDINAGYIENACAEKARRVARYLHHQDKPTT